MFCKETVYKSEKIPMYPPFYGICSQKEGLKISKFLSLHEFDPLSTNPTKWVKHIQAIRRLLPTNCLSVFDHFVELALEGLSSVQRRSRTLSNIDNTVFLKKVRDGENMLTIFAKTSTMFDSVLNTPLVLTLE